MIQVKDIELFKDLSQNEYEGKWFDFHNDYDCVRIILKIGGLLVLLFKRIKDNKLVSIKFKDVIIEQIEFFNFYKVEHLTIDNLYRGKVEKNGNLLEYNKDKRGYFYLEFDEGQKLEFWSSGMYIRYITEYT